jgi:polyhydroxyalkanoate synthase
VLAVVGERDKVCPRGAVVALNDAVGSSVKDVLEVPGGHVGAVVGPDAPRVFYPRLVDWLRRNTATSPLGMRAWRDQREGHA